MTVIVRLKRGGPWRSGQPRWHEYVMEVPGDFTMVELLEAIKGEKDPSLTFRHSCHHGSCGTCAMKVNGVERLGCTMSVAEVAPSGGRLTIEPLGHLPWVADLVVDPAALSARLEALGPGHVRSDGIFANCIECGACVSACPVAGPGGGYLGPAALAAARDALVSGQVPGVGWNAMQALADGPHGVWQCHSAYECSRVCPAGVDPAGAIVELRQLLLGRKTSKPPAAQGGGVALVKGGERR